VLHLQVHLPHLLLVLLLQTVNVLLHPVLQLLQLLLRVLLHLTQLLLVLLLHVLRLHLCIMHSLVGRASGKACVFKVCRKRSCIAFCSGQLLTKALVLGAHELHGNTSSNAAQTSGLRTARTHTFFEQLHITTKTNLEQVYTFATDHLSSLLVAATCPLPSSSHQQCIVYKATSRSPMSA
jgi:hypothetical protein